MATKKGKKDTCHGKSKAKATKRRKELNAKGTNARVVKNADGNFCVYTFGKRK